MHHLGSLHLTINDTIWVSPHGVFGTPLVLAVHFLTFSHADLSFEEKPGSPKGRLVEGGTHT